MSARPVTRRSWITRWPEVGLALITLIWPGQSSLQAAGTLPTMQPANARTIPGLELDLVRIAPGTYSMGILEESGLKKWFKRIQARLPAVPYWNDPANRDRSPPRVVRQVTISKSFWLGKTEVTQAQWRALMGSDAAGSTGDTLPVGRVTWDDAMEFCRKLTERENLAARLPAGYAYTLPTEAQWEYVCRAGVKGNDAGDRLKAYGWFTQEVGGKLKPVGGKRPNRWGIYDMHGNAAEWCLDWYAEYPGGSATDPAGPDAGIYRVHRGGCSSNYAFECDSGQRGVAPPVARDGSIGFRIALSPVR